MKQAAAAKRRYEVEVFPSSCFPSVVTSDLKLANYKLQCACIIACYLALRLALILYRKGGYCLVYNGACNLLTLFINEVSLSLLLRKRISFLLVLYWICLIC